MNESVTHRQQSLYKVTFVLSCTISVCYLQDIYHILAVTAETGVLIYISLPPPSFSCSSFTLSALYFPSPSSPPTFPPLFLSTQTFLLQKLPLSMFYFLYSASTLLENSTPPLLPRSLGVENTIIYSFVLPSLPVAVCFYWCFRCCCLFWLRSHYRTCSDLVGVSIFM